MDAFKATTSICLTLEQAQAQPIRMSSYLYASSTAQSIDGEYEVRIIENTSGTDSTEEFDVGPQGVNLIYEDTDDTLLLPASCIRGVR